MPEERGDHGGTVVNDINSQTTPPRLDLTRPRYDQSTFNGRAKHFFEVTDPRNLLVSSFKLEKANRIVIKYKNGDLLPELTEEDLWEAKRLADSAYHPETGEKMFILGRMSAQVPCNMTITGLMMTFYKHPAAVVYWQWINQSFNAIVNYTNRSGNEPISKQPLFSFFVNPDGYIFNIKQLFIPYIAATSCATATAVGLNILTKNLPPLIGRFVPFVAVAAANCINIPLMRQREIKNGIVITDADGNQVGMSKNAAKKAITQVAFSRIGMAMPGMVIPAIIMNTLDKRNFFKRLPWATAPMQIGLVGLCLAFATPLCCAIFPQQSSIKVSKLEPDLREKLQSAQPNLTKVYYNKGL